MQLKSLFEHFRRLPHEYRAQDANGKLFDVTSATETDDIFNGGLYDAGRANYTGALAGAYANVYWTVAAPFLTREIQSTGVPPQSTTSQTVATFLSQPVRI
jgi:hypothetical protein